MPEIQLLNSDGHVRELSIGDYRPEWKAEFEAIATHLRLLVGNSVTRIDHIGSTAVPGLVAKNVIDIQLTVVDLNEMKAVSILQSKGWVFKPGVAKDLLAGHASDSTELEKKFLCERPGQRRTNLHIRQEKRINQEYPLVFRDYLRSAPVARESYASLKMQLARHFEDDINAYYSIKDPFMDSVYQAAKLWAELRGWSPDQNFS